MLVFGFLLWGGCQIIVFENNQSMMYYLQLIHHTLIISKYDEIL